MLKRLAQASLGLFLAVAPSLGVVINFDDVGSPTGNAGDISFDAPLAVLGITITGDGNTSFLGVNVGGSIVPLSGNYLQVNSLNDSPATQSVVIINFDRFNNGSTWARGDSVLVDLQDTEQNILIRLFGPGNVQIGGDITFLALAATVDFPALLGLTATDRISYMEITDLGGDGYILDNLRYELEHDSSVPEPSAYVMMASGLLALGMLRRRR
jgi:hypothetical protein